MAIDIIPDNDGNGFIEAQYFDDFEYVNPIEQVKNMSFESSISLDRTMLLLRKPPFPITYFDNLLYKRAEKFWQERYNEIKETKYSENFDQLLKCHKKQEQINLLKNQTISPLGLTAFIFNAYEKSGYTYSQYVAEHNHNGLDETRLPTLMYTEGSDVVISGKTDLTDGQLKQVIDHRKVIISKFIGKGENWHCFFTTYQSLDGKESWKNGTPHYHYISNAFGSTREDVLNQLKSKNYQLNSLPHIELTDYNS